MYVGGALGLEVVGSYLATRLGRESIPYEATVIVEEFCEMVGVVIFLYALHVHLSPIAATHIRAIRSEAGSHSPGYITGQSRAKRQEASKPHHLSHPVRLPLVEPRDTHTRLQVDQGPAHLLIRA